MTMIFIDEESTYPLVIQANEVMTTPEDLELWNEVLFTDIT